MKNVFKSIGAVLAGLLFIVVTHSGIDAILHTVGILPDGHFYVETWLILVVIGYRSLFSIAGCYLAARLAPQKPMAHALALGVLGAVLSTGGAIVNTQLDLGPDWYAWALVVLAVPLAYLGGKLYKPRPPKLSAVNTNLEELQ